MAVPHLQVPIKGLPFSAAFKYAVYTHGFVMVSGVPRFTPEHPAFSGTNGPASACPTQAGRLPITDMQVMKDGHMLTGYVSDSVLQCMLWALHAKGLLAYDIKDGDLPNVRMRHPLQFVLVQRACSDYRRCALRSKTSGQLMQQSGHPNICNSKHLKTIQHAQCMWSRPRDNMGVT
jgi:hypothetical protein